MNNRGLLSEKIKKTLQDLSPDNARCSIFKVPGCLRRVNERAYEPEILSIGPYHRGKDNLKMMEEHKKRYLQKILQRSWAMDLASYVEAMRDLEESAHQCYDQSISLGDDDFVEMLLLDGCFIVELICKGTTQSEPQQGDDQNDPVTENPWILYSITVDMLLLENQLPFFVLLKLFSMVMPNINEGFFRERTVHFFEEMLPGLGLERNNNNTISSNRSHLLEVVYQDWQRSAPPMTIPSAPTDKQLKFIRCAKELKEAGIKFKKREGSHGLLHGVNFENGAMEIPFLKIEDTTEYLLRNLVAYEQCSGLKQGRYVTDYTIFMDCLINTKEDVRILRHCGIIENWLGDDEMVCTLFNKLGTNVVLSDPDRFHYAGVFHLVNEHCKWPLNKWLAKLRHDYFNSPWAWISFLAALALLVLTFLQTVFTVKS